MTDDRLIPLDTLHRILPVFGITKPTPAYERWVRPEGLPFRDVFDVLGDSAFVVTIDWGDFHEDAVGRVAEALRQLDVEIQTAFEADGNTGVVRCAGGETAVARDDENPYVGIQDTMLALQRIAPGIEFRESPGNSAGDDFTYAVLRRDEWRQLVEIAPEFVAAFFAPLNTPGKPGG